MEKVTQLFQKQFGNSPTSVVRLPLEGSNRAYYKIAHDDIVCIGVENNEIRENNAFIYLTRHFEAKGLNVPHILAVNEDGSAYLQTFLEGDSLFDKLANDRKNQSFGDEAKELLKRTLKELLRFQFIGSQGLDYTQCYPLSEMNRRALMWDLNYFKYSFLKLSGVDFDEVLLEDDFEALVEAVYAMKGNTFVYRDFQSRNVIVKDRTPYFIDYQGGRKGLLLYDLASFVWQSRAAYPEELKYELAEYYREELSAYCPISKEEFYTQLELMLLFRSLQVLGAYGFRGWIEGKARFVEALPMALNNLHTFLLNSEVVPPYLRTTLLQVINKLLVDDLCAVPKDALLVTIMSFSYKQGLPKDNSGNGGGFLFDCRALHNPGRYDEYKQLTGRDESVVQFLEKEQDTASFFENSCQLVEASVKRYVERGFSNLFVGYGCTGGQHRSVYMAESLFRYLQVTYPNVHYKLVHREQRLSFTFHK